MKLFISSVLSISVLYLVSSVSGGPYPEVNIRAVNATPPNSTSDDDHTTKGYDPSYDWQQWRTVEIWTSRKAVNWGDLRGEELYAQVHSLLQNVCPWSGTNLCPGSPQDPTEWLDFTTNTPISDSQAESKLAWLRIFDGQWSSPGARNIMIELAARTLEAYVSQDKDYNCYEQSGKVYCNVPRHVRVNLPWDDRTHDRQINAMHVETWGTNYGDQFGDVSPKGKLRPCKSRTLVDKVMDSMKDDLVKEFPDWKDRFSRETRVIIDGYTVCTDEP